MGHFRGTGRGRVERREGTRLPSIREGLFMSLLGNSIQRSIPVLWIPGRRTVTSSRVDVHRPIKGFIPSIHSFNLMSRVEELLEPGIPILFSPIFRFFVLGPAQSIGSTWPKIQYPTRRSSSCSLFSIGFESPREAFPD